MVEDFVARNFTLALSRRGRGNNLFSFNLNLMTLPVKGEGFIGNAEYYKFGRSNEIHLPPEIKEKAEAPLSQVKIEKRKEPYTDGDLAFLIIKQEGMEKVSAFANEMDLLINESLAILLDVFKERKV